MKRVLVTGGAGYVGAHCCKAFAQAGWDVTVYDNLSRGWRDAVRWGPLIEGDILDHDRLFGTLQDFQPDIVAHFAALAYVGESVSDPALYYRNNTAGTLTLLECMKDAGVQQLIFSSTCASYGMSEVLPIDEAQPQQPINPYGRSKLFVERMIEDFSAAYGLSAVILRYFNAAGCDPEGEIGERHEPETHAVPLAIEAALGGAPFRVLGTDFNTRDGSAIRDYIHVTDLADAHVRAAHYLAAHDGCTAFNLGTETGTSVLELLAAIERLTGRPVPAEMAPRRAGDPPILIAAASKATRDLGWIPRYSSIDQIVQSALLWAKSAKATPPSSRTDTRPPEPGRLRAIGGHKVDHG